MLANQVHQLMSNKFIIFRATPELVEGLDEVIESMKANTKARVTKTDALKYLITFYKESNKMHQMLLKSSLEKLNK